MTEKQWLEHVNSILKGKRVPAVVLAHAVNEGPQRFQSGISPAVYANELFDRWKESQATQAAQAIANRRIIPVPQTSAVLSDPKYQLDTGIGVLCPTCGSTFIKVLNKEGTGLGYLGSIG